MKLKFNSKHNNINVSVTCTQAYYGEWSVVYNQEPMSVELWNPYVYAPAPCLSLEVYYDDVAVRNLIRNARWRSLNCEGITMEILEEGDVFTRELMWARPLTETGCILTCEPTSI